MARRECTPEEARQWSGQYQDGYMAARGDILWHAGPRIELIEIPPEDPYVTGSEYVAMHVGMAWAIGYTAAWQSELSRCCPLVPWEPAG